MDDDTQPATKADVRILARTITDGDDAVRMEIKRMYDSQERMLDTLVAIDQRWKVNFGMHGDRLKRIETHIGLAA